MTFKSTPLYLKLRLSKSMMNVVVTKMTRIAAAQLHTLTLSIYKMG